MTYRLFLLLVVACGCTGCDLVRPLWYRPDSKIADAYSKLQYPADAPLGEDLDIVVIQKTLSVQMVNREPLVFDDVMIWLNQQYAGHADHITIGTDNSYGLNNFVNQYKEPFPIGNILQPERRVPIVLAELIDKDGKRRRLLVHVKLGEK